MVCRIAAIVVVVSSAGVFLGRDALAQQPATAPAPVVIDIPADPSTPKGTLILLSRATMTGDPAPVQGLFHATTPIEQRLAAVLLERTIVYAKFRQALVAGFGEDAAAELTGNRADDEPIAEQRISQAELKIDGDKASVQIKGDPGQPPPEPVQLVKIDGRWKLPVGKLTEGMKDPEVESKMQEFKTLSEVVSQLTDEVRQTRYKSVNEVSDALRGKIATAMLAQQTTSRPATQP